MACRTDRSSAYFLDPSAHQWLARLAGRIAHRRTSSFLPPISGLPGSPDGALFGLLARSFRSSVACPARRMERSSAYLPVPSAHQWLARLTGRIAHRLTCSFLPLVSGLPSAPDGSLIDLLPRSFRSSVACPARRTERSSAYFLVSSARQWLARRFLGRIAHRLTSSFLPLVSGLPDGSLVGLLPLPSAHQWLARLADKSAHRLTSSFLPLVSGLHGSLDGTLIDLLPRSFRSSVACPARWTDRSLAYFLIPSTHQWLARLAGRSAHRLTSSFLPRVSGLPGSPDGSLIDLLPRFFRSSVARPTVPRTDRSSAYFLVSSARQWLAGRIACRLTSSSFRSSVACPARQTDRSSTYFLVSSAHQWLARRFLGRIAHRLTSSFLPLISGSPDGCSDGSLTGLLPHSFRSSVARPTVPRTDRSSAYFLVPPAHQWLARLAGRSAHRLTSSFLPLASGLRGSPDGSLIDLLPRFFRSSVACPACRTDRSSTYFLVSSACQWLARRFL